MGASPMAELCQICETRRPRRACPGLRGDICAPCCGAEREVTVDCPFDCEYLREARRHERPPEVNPDEFPNRDIRVTESFLREHEELLMFVSQALFQAAVETPGAIDLDVREALDAVIRTHRTLDSGLYYETRPANPLAAGVQLRLGELLAEYRKALQERTGMNTLRDAELLGVIAFLQRLEIQHNNGRRRSRAFLDFLRGYFARPSESLIVQPGGAG